ncbi:DUF262 domain-containing protein [Pueribacillus sp. YX66]|uniref:DUF262 domain-containing protein n=1 Tax=Pueribacillus sp. YX66 TaxID=3229242 RepID=UPI00358D6090
MDAGTIRLLEFLYPPKSVFRIPVYQRRYEWTEEQINQYFNDIEKIALNNDIEGHFLGTIVFVKTSFPSMGSDYIIIDGQQRITTTFLFLKAIYNSIDNENTRADIKETYFENRNVEEEYKYKLISVEDDRKDFLELLIHNEYDKPSKIHMNYKRLIYLIQHSKATSEQLFDALQKIRIVYIELEQGKKEENPQVIFESLNSTGLSLTESDLIRNFLLMNEKPMVQEHLYKNYWLLIEEMLTNAKISDFIRDYLTMKTSAIPNKNKVYQNFKHYMIKNQISSEVILADLLKFARYYNELLNPNNKNKIVQNHLMMIIQLKSTVTYPYLLRLFDKYYDKNEINKEQFINILTIINSYLIRRSIVNFPTNALNKVFSTIGKDADKNKEKRTEEESVMEYLLSRTGSALFPRNEKLKESILNDDMYNRNHRLAKLILSQIEIQTHKEIVDFEEVTIEHILPATLTPSWRVELGDNAIDDHKLYKDVLGNLTLTNYNSELSNKSFNDKVTYYQDSNIKLTREVCRYNTWNKESIHQRGINLYKKIIEIWPIPEDRYDKGKEKEIIGDTYYSVFELLSVTGKKPKVLVIADEEFIVNSWKHTLITYLNWLADFDIEQYLELPKQKSFQKLLSYTDEVLRKSEEVMSIFVETNLSAQSIYNYISSLTEYYDMEDDVFIRLDF